MKRCWVFCLLSFVFCLSVWAETIGKIVAIVNDEVITQQELEDAVREYPERGDLKGAALRRKVLDRLVEDRLILQKARDENISVPPEEIEDAVRKIKNRYPSQKAFEDALLETGYSYKAFENRHREQWMVRKLVSKEVRARCRVSPGEVEGYYKSHPEEFQGPEVWKLSHILIQKRVAAKEDPEARQLARHILKRLRKGEDFHRLARNYSQGPRREEGGDLGYVERRKLMKEIETDVARLPVGGISNLIETAAGYNIFRLEDRKEAMPRQLKEVKGKIHDHLLQEKIMRRYEEWIAELKKNAYIKE